MFKPNPVDALLPRLDAIAPLATQLSCVCRVGRELLPLLAPTEFLQAAHGAPDPATHPNHIFRDR